LILVAVSDVENAPSAEVGVNLGSRLRLARQRSGLTLREVARRLGVSASFVSQLENGKSQPSVVTLYSLTQLLGVSIDQMFEQDRSPASGEAPASRRRQAKRGPGDATRRRCRGAAGRREPDQPLGPRLARRRLAAAGVPPALGDDVSR
jgi:transcriptional regulator with XRE-family HTH domain